MKAAINIPSPKTGKLKPLRALAKENNMPYSTVYGRYKNGWTGMDLITNDEQSYIPSKHQHYKVGDLMCVASKKQAIILLGIGVGVYQTRLARGKYSAKSLNLDANQYVEISSQLINSMWKPASLVKQNRNNYQGATT